MGSCTQSQAAGGQLIQMVDLRRSVWVSNKHLDVLSVWWSVLDNAVVSV